MSTGAVIEPPPDLTQTLPRRRWTTAEYDEMVNKGIIREGSRTFLWDGEVIEPMSENQPHRNAVANILWLLVTRLGRQEWTVDVNGPLPLRDGYKPQPDVSVIKGKRSGYRKRVPGPDVVALLIEVSESTYGWDSRALRDEYAARGIAQYWIVNLAKRRVEVYARPSRGEGGATGYLDRKDYGLGETIPVVIEHGGSRFEWDGVPVRDILDDSLDDDEDSEMNGTK